MSLQSVCVTGRVESESGSQCIVVRYTTKIEPHVFERRPSRLKQKVYVNYGPYKNKIDRRARTITIERSKDHGTRDKKIAVWVRGATVFIKVVGEGVDEIIKDPPTFVGRPLGRIRRDRTATVAARSRLVYKQRFCKKRSGFKSPFSD